LMRVPGLSRR
ncbi:outer membrane autotransporter barrel domain protein, partial [Escherichia coli 95.0943]